MFTVQHAHHPGILIPVCACCTANTERNVVNTFNYTTPLPWGGILPAAMGVSLSTVVDAGTKLSGQIHAVTGTPIIDSKRTPQEMTRMVEVRLRSGWQGAVQKEHWQKLLISISKKQLMKEKSYTCYDKQK